MKRLFRETALLSIAAALSWFVLLAGPERPAGSAAPRPLPLELAVVPVSPTSAASGETQEVALPTVQERPESAEDSPAVEPEDPAQEELAREELAQEAPDQEAPAPAELGAVDGRGDAAPTATADSAPAEPAETPLDAEAFAGEVAADSAASSEERSTARVRELLGDQELLDAARAEWNGDVRAGFQTTLLAAPEEQLDIARAFGEELVLIPRDALVEGGSRWFRLDLSSGTVRSVDGAPPTGYRQYRDLLDYEYERLPAALRDLRKSVLARNEIFVFGALIPLREWGLVVARRREALERTGRPLEDVKRFVVHYRPLAPGSYDFEVHEIVFADGTRVRPDTL